MAIDTVSDVLGAVPGARPTSTFRTPERQAQLVAEWERTGRRGQRPATNSHHSRGTPENPGAVDLTPAPGETMAQLHARVRASGVNTLELLNEGDHVHVAVSGAPRDPSAGTAPADRLMLNPITGQMEMARVVADDGERLDGDVFVDGRWHRNVDGGAGAVMRPAEPLDQTYARRQAERESLALDQEDADLANAVQAGFGVSDQMAGAVLKDVGKGVFAEGGQAVVSGVKRGFNAIMDLTDEAGDWIETYVPGTIAWEGFDGDASTPARIRLTTQNKAQEQQEGAQDGQRSIWQRLGAGRIRAPQTEAERPESVTGRMIEGVTQFATGFAGGGQLLRGWQVAGRAGQIGKSLVQGALADFSAFDGQEARLSNLLAEHAPEALAPALEFMAADEDDPEILGRFKNALEGAVLGGAVDVLGQGIRRLRAARQVRTAARDAARAEGLQIDPTLPAAEREAAGQQAQAVIREALGSPEGPRFRVRTDPTTLASKVDPAAADGIDAATIAAARPTDNIFDINLARIDTPDDVKAVITGIADRLSQSVDLARRATVSHEQTLAASRGVDWVSSMGARRVGDAANAETITAYRAAMNASASKVLELARRVASKTEPLSTAERAGLQYAFRRATATHAAIQNEFLGARAEAGRALNAFKIPVGTPARTLDQIDLLLAETGTGSSRLGPVDVAGTNEVLANRILKAAENGDVTLNQMLRHGAMARSRDIFRLVYTNSLLSGLGTPIINAVGTPIAMGINLANRFIAPRMASMLGDVSHTKVGEASALIHGYQQAMRDIFALNPLEAARRIGENGGEALRREGIFRGMAPGIDDAGQQMGIALRPAREEAGGLTGASNARPLGAAAWRVSEDSVLGRLMDVAQMFIEAPSNITGLTDDFFKVIAARGELHAQAFRKVQAEGLTDAAASARLRDLIDNPTDEMMSAAEAQMHELTFTRSDGQFDKALGGLRRMIDENSGPVPAASYLALPFLRTPANLTSLAVRTGPLAPLSARFRNSLAAGGAERETALAQAAVGTALWSVWMGMALDGQISGSGPGSIEQKQAMMRADETGRAAWQPYSVQLSGRWYSFERADPIGTAMSLIGDFAELANNDDWTGANQEQMSEIAANAMISIGSAFFDKTVLRSAFEFTEALTSGNVTLAERYLMSKASASLPASSALRMLRRGQDPYMRETHDFLTAIKNTVPGLSDDLPVSRDLWGKPRTYQTGLGTVYDAIVPVQTREAGGSAIDQEILTNGVSVRMPSKSISVMGSDVSLKNRPDIYDRMLELGGQPAFDHLNAVVSGSHPDSEYYFSLADGPGGGDGDETKGDYILDTLRAYRSDARLQIIDEFAADLQGMAAEKDRRRNEVRLDR